jgi:hypothetical protein
MEEALDLVANSMIKVAKHKYKLYKRCVPCYRYFHMGILLLNLFILFIIPLLIFIQLIILG